MGLDPRAHFPAGVPARIVPDQHQSTLAFLGQAHHQPFQKLCRDVADRASVDKAKQHLLIVGAQHALAGDGFGIRIVLVRFLSQQAQGVLTRPGMQVRLSQT